ncbi:MAG: exopolysaccharide biosynthesis protein [bacterium F083]|nr:MAG: exopolysaccharide biosynthesis protein [bacterium F083]
MNKIQFKLKRILPMYINFYIKHFFELLLNNKPDLKIMDGKKYVFFLDAPAYGNVGDQAIAFSMEKFMLDKFPQYVACEIQEKNFCKYFNYLKKIIKQDDLICLTGGGNMGDVYQKYEMIRRLVIKHFPNNRIIIFPQTISYTATRYGKKELNRARKVYNNSRNLLLMAREEKSYNIMTKEFPNANVVLCPDIVLYLDYMDTYKRGNKVGYCLRNDIEKAITCDLESKIKEKYKNHEKVSTTFNIDEDITFNNRKNVVEKVLNEFGTKELIFTDRLHGMIFSFITNTPCVAFPNSNGKIENVYKWIENKGNVVFSKKLDISYCKKIKRNVSIQQEFNVVENKINELINNGK